MKTSVMNILFTAAEQEELDCALKAYREIQEEYGADIPTCGNAPKISFHLTGIGAVQACHKVTGEILRGIIKGEPYNIVANIGIAGSYDMEAFPMGSAAVISREHFGDLGFGTKEGFKDLFEYGILEENGFPYTAGALARPDLPYSEIEKVLHKYGNGVGVTVQTVTGDPAKVEELRNRYTPHIESMEGAAVYYAAIQENVPFFELRTVSNAVGERNRKNWDIPAALSTLEECCREIMKGIFKQCGYGKSEKGDNKD